MNEIDTMDIFYYFDVLGYRNKNIDIKTGNKKEKDIYIDQCNWL